MYVRYEDATLVVSNLWFTDLKEKFKGFKMPLIILNFVF